MGAPYFHVAGGGEGEEVGAGGARAEDLPALEAALEAALRASGAASTALQRSAHAAAARHAEALLHAVADTLAETETFAFVGPQGERGMDGAFADLLVNTVPRARRLARQAGVALDAWADEVREEVMGRIANSASSQYVGPVVLDEWPAYAGHLQECGSSASSTFHLSRGGLVEFSLHFAVGEAPGALQGEGTWALEDEEVDLSRLRLDLRQGLDGTGHLCGSREPPRVLHVNLNDFRRVSLHPDGVISDKSEDD